MVCVPPCWATLSQALRKIIVDSDTERDVLAASLCVFFNSRLALCIFKDTHNIHFRLRSQVILILASAETADF
ncbi:uncharacterized protein Bfra_010659 [Botrytis fragariae]|uniref:Uncharacterized protein n=1 Tax=Botrytis fragariae TaxID=1964551 RepID=A0A8H6EDC4_9HELO|nr:uncharacterized protein Bfra_010659 [Botrytis fragariae]KAF5867690.1 hypothetical protein Bfra_010659 [Botrytis fragariae]